jgi:hypothetical protein
MAKSSLRTGLALLVILLAAGAMLGQSRTPKALEGKVLGNGDVPLSGAVVYLQDSKTNNIRSFISTADGSYRFGQISPDTDYQVWAEYKGVKSPTKAISSFDSRKQVTIDLRIKSDK